MILQHARGGRFDIILTFVNIVNHFIARTQSLKVKPQVIRFVIICSPWESFFLWAFSLGGWIVGARFVIAFDPDVMAAQHIVLVHGCLEGCMFCIAALVSSGQEEDCHIE